MYFDPGLGSLVFQVLLGFLLAVPVLLGVYWRKVRSFFRGRFRGNRESS